MKRRFRLIPLLMGTMACCALMQGQQSAPSLQRRGADEFPVIHTEARLVVLDIVVTDGQGHPVTGLKPGDFKLFEDGRPQTLKSFEEHAPADPATAARAMAAMSAKLPPNTFTNYTPVAASGAANIILLDALDTPVEAQMYLREQMIDYMKTVPPGMPIAIFQLDTQMHMVQGLTTDPAELRAAVNGKRDRPVLSPLLGGPATPGYVRERMRRDILTQALQGLARYLAAFPGRKNLIWFTGALPISLYGDGPLSPFPDVTSFLEEFNKTTDVLTLNRIAVYPIDARGLRVDPRFSAANSGIGRGRGDGFTRRAFQQGYLDDVAATTGGKAFYNTNGLKNTIAEIVDTGSHYYTVSYTPTNSNWDGKYRRLKVTTVREGLHLQYRKGYYARVDERARQQHIAANAEGQAGADDAAMQASMQMGAVAPTQIGFAAKITPAETVTKDAANAPAGKGNYLSEKLRKKGYRNYAIRYAINANDLQLMPTPDLTAYHGRIQLVAVLYDSQGQRMNSDMGELPLDIDKATYEQVERSGLVTGMTIAVPVKGDYFLRLGVRDMQTGRIGALEVPMDRVKAGS
ncbi:MAG TPA: VWA domain-containing protein [Edaphobacter sp.]|nr:VWA domain-containing protein [Edaphobacter sp.]